MSLGDWFLPSGALTQAQQDAGLAQEQAQLAAAMQARMDAGTLTPDQQAADTALLGETNDSTTVGALEGAAVGATELAWDPSQWVADMQTGAGMVASGIGTSSNFVLDLIKKILAGVPWWVWLLLGIGIFLWFGGWKLLLKIKLK